MSIVEKAKRVKTIAEIGLLYSINEYDIERYSELLKISEELLANEFGIPVNIVQSFYEPCKEYPTVKVDVRGIILNEKDEILLVKEV